MKKTKPKLFGKKAFSTRGQSNDLRSLYEFAGYRLKVSAHLDSSYSFQNRLSVLVWSDVSLTWNVLATMHWSEAASPRAGHAESALISAEKELLKRAVWVLNPTPERTES